MFDIYNPKNLDFRDYINICQVARAWADGYDRKSVFWHLAPNVAVDYTGVVPAWGLKHYTATDFANEWISTEHLGLRVLATQHLMGLHYFMSVSDSEIVVEWQLIASHGRRLKGEDYANPMCKIEAQSNHRSYMQHTFVKVEDGQWRIARIRPEVIFQPGDFMKVRRQEDK